MFLILNRIRGTNGVYSKVIGLFYALVIATILNHQYSDIVAWAFAVGYIGGEALYTWGEGIGNLTVHRIDLWKWRIFIAIRGFAWWCVALISLYFVGFNPHVLIGSLIFLSVGFPIACELGYYSAKYLSMYYNKDKKQYEIHFNGKLVKVINKEINFSVVGGWEHQEVWYGLMQDIVLISLVLTKL